MVKHWLFIDLSN